MLSGLSVPHCNCKNNSANIVVEIVGMTVAGRGCFVVVVIVVVHHGSGFFSVFLSLRHGPALDFPFSHKKVEERASDDDTSADEEDDAPLRFRALADKEMDRSFCHDEIIILRNLNEITCYSVISVS